MDMAEKDETEGRCPACRTPYNKEKIVGTTAKRERLIPIVVKNFQPIILFSPNTEVICHVS